MDSNSRANIYVIDYYKENEKHGLDSYIKQLQNNFINNSNLKFTFIWVGSNIILPKYEIINGVCNFYLPVFVNNVGFNSKDEYWCELIYSRVTNQSKLIFHFNWFDHLSLALFLKKRMECTIIFTKHCIPWRDFITTDYKLFKSLNRNLVCKISNIKPSFINTLLIREKLTYTQFEHIICVTNFAKRTLRKLFQIPDSKSTVIHNGLHYKPRIQKDKAKLKKEYGFAENEKIILYAGAVNQRKGVFDLVAAFSTLVEKEIFVRLVIAGNGEHSRIFEKIEKCWSKITITGPLDKKTLYDFYQMADIGIVPSYVEQCSYTAIEMMHSGLPIIVSDVDGLAEIVPDNCGLKVPLILGKNAARIDDRILREKILYFLNNPDIAKEYAKRAKVHACKNFTASRMAKETIAVYEKLITEKDSQSSKKLTLDSSSPLVSIILPCYNAEKYLQECISSILNQTYNKFELIIIDDGSTDTSYEIAESNKDSRITILKNNSNTGIVSCLNASIKLTKGKYIARIDADDMMHRERLEKQVSFLEDDKNKEIVLVGSNHFIIDSNSHNVSLKQFPITDSEIKACMLFQNPFSHPSVMIRTNILKKEKYSNKFNHAEDYQLWFKLSTNYKMANIPEFLTYYRIHAQNTSAQKGKQQKENTAELLSMELEKLGLDYTSRELATHIAINSGLALRYFNTTEKINEGKDWVNKVLTTVQKKFALNNKSVKEVKHYILENYCGL